MATDEDTDHRAGDTKPDSETTNTGQLASPLNLQDIDDDNVDSKDDKVDITNDLRDGADVGAPETQGSDLPKLTQVIITNVPQLKHNSKNPEIWDLRVKFALAQLRLQHLINSSVPRPARGQHNFNRWVQWSRTVARWLYLQVDGIIQEKLQRLRKIPSTADALFDNIMKMVRESDKAVNARPGTNNYDSRKRSDVETVRKYIATHQSQHHLLGSNLLPTSSLRYRRHTHQLYR